MTEDIEPKKTTAFAHVCKHRLLYIGLPGAIILIPLALWLVSALTGRATFQPNDPSTSADVLIGYAYNVLTVVLALVLTWLVKTNENLNRDFNVNDKWQAYMVSRLQTVLLVALFLWALKH